MMRRGIKNSVLVIDDDVVVHFVSARILYSLGYSNIYSAFNGQEAIDLLMKCSQAPHTMPTIILLDLNMPVMDGLQFLREFNRWRELSYAQFVLAMISSTMDSYQIQEAKSLGVDHFFPKPVSPEIVSEIVAKAVPPAEEPNDSWYFRKPD